MAGDPVPGPYDEEHELNTLINHFEALYKALPGIILVLKNARAQARKEASG